MDKVERFDNHISKQDVDKYEHFKKAKYLNFTA